MPFVRYPPEGFHSNLTISLPFTIDFDKLGLTDNENPYGVLPPLLARSMGNSVADLLGNYIESMLDHKKKRRQKRENMPKLSEKHLDAFHGGERAILYMVVQDFLENFGLDGKACLLRAICEIHAHPLRNFGLFGEFFKLFLTASKSPYSHLLNEYVEAEKSGRGTKDSPGECWPYLKDCPKSLFLPKHNKYSEELDENDNEIDDGEHSVTYKADTLKM
nr:uncharacterized protein LOC111415735 isoform X2 [Onthophagus taurus]